MIIAPSIHIKSLIHDIRDALKRQSRISRAVGGLLLLGSMSFTQVTAALDVSELDVSNGFTINTSAISGHLSYGIDDVNGDGVADIIVAQQYHSISHIIFGRDDGSFPSSVDADQLTGADGFTVVGDFRGASDINVDGIADLFFNTRVSFDDINYELFVLFGRNVAQAGDFSANISAADVNGSNGFRLDYPNNGGNWNISSQGDISGDGIDDILVDETVDILSGGNVDQMNISLYVVLGRNGISFPSNIRLLKLDGEDGFRVQDAYSANANAEDCDLIVDSSNRIDFDGDDINEIAIILQCGDPDKRGEVEIAFISEQASNGVFPAIINTLDDVRSFSTDGGSFRSFPLINAGDINGDGVDDMVISSSSSYIGSSTLFFGADNNSAFEPGERTLRLQHNDIGGFAGVERPQYLGDINDDAIDDITFLGINKNNIADSTITERYILFGRNEAVDGAFPEQITPEFFDGNNGFILSSSFEQFFADNGTAGDLNGDGINDLILNQSSLHAADSMSVLFGRRDFSKSVSMEESNGLMITGLNFGRVPAVTDINGDGADDLIISHADAAYVVFVTPGVGKPILACPGDVDNSGTQDVAVLIADPDTGMVTAGIKDLAGAELSRVVFAGISDTATVKVIADQNNNDTDELAVVGRRFGQIQVRDSLSGELLSSIEADSTTVDIESVADQTGNGVLELALLGVNREVEIIDPLTAAQVSTVPFPPTGYHDSKRNSVDLAVFNSLPPLLAVLLDDPYRGSISDRVEVRNALSGAEVTNMWFGKGYDSTQIELMADINGNGVQELAVLRKNDDAYDVKIRDSQTGVHVRRVGYSPNYTPIKMTVMSDINNNGSDEIVVLDRHKEQDYIRVTVKDSMTKQRFYKTYFDRTLTPIDIAVCGDMSGNNKPDLVMLGERTNGQLRLIIKDAETGEFVGTVDYL